MRCATVARLDVDELRRRRVAHLARGHRLDVGPRDGACGRRG
jgi:hypothetical protein